MLAPNKITERLFSWLGRNTVWLFATVLLFFAYALLLTVMKADGVGAYLTLFGRLAVLYAPVLLYTAFRHRIRGWGRGWNALTWVLAFPAYAALGLFKMRAYGHFLFAGLELKSTLGNIAEFSVNFFPFVSGVLLSVEIWILLTTDRGAERRFRWATRLSTDGWILVAGLSASMLAGLFGGLEFAGRNPGYGKVNVLLQMLSFGLQLCLIFLVYFGFYRWNRRWLIPKLYQPHGFLHYLAGAVATILLVYPFCAWLWRQLPVVREMELEIFTPLANTFSGDGGGLALLVMLLSLPFVVSGQWLKQGAQIRALEQEKTRAELALLKQQLNPHFFFNTLNNLYALSITRDGRTPEVVMQLSELMRYVIYRGAATEVRLGEEIDYLKDYVSLQRIRLSRDFAFSLETNGVDAELRLPPLLFINLVENAFKHGIEPAEHPAFLHLSFQREGEWLVFRCRNSVEEATETSSGLGLDNLRRRLDLRFPGRHALLLDREDNEYSATLKIQLP